ncbi:GLPGLI family protein [Chryseobacterium sp. SIMBA_029]|uniref:GLPGLI family protein n=1 Tax=Chryseobacterium sp. SIMBA_029 TaxID=3085772 RepID=UPI00397AD93D
MKNIILILFICTQSLLAQSKRFTYEYRFVPDSTNKQNVLKEPMFLDIGNKISIFSSQRKYISDSTIIADSKQGKFGMPPSDLIILYRIEKIDGKVFYKTNDYGLDRIKVDDDRKIEWKVLPDKQKIGEFNTQKAVTNFGGRRWTAWFTTEIPLQDGPYKFQGLPGLIIKIEDSTNSHSFELAEISNLKEIGYPERGKETKETSFNLADFKKYYLQYRNDPGANVKKLYTEGRLPDFTDTSGNFHTGAETVRNVEKLAIERLKKDNNIIELELLKK